jgi:O-antigen/teichoic acid export membrane protein
MKQSGTIAIRPPRSPSRPDPPAEESNGTLAEMGWRPLLRAASLTGFAGLASGVLAALATKIFAMMLGPAELAVLATLQQIRQAGLTVSTLNGQTALIQGLSARIARERREFLRTVLLLMTGATTVVMAAAWTFAGWLARTAGLATEHVPLIRWLAVPVALSCALVFLSAVLGARGAIGLLGLVQLASPGAMAILAYPLARAVRPGQEGAFVVWIGAAALVAVAAALAVLLRQRIRHWFRGDGEWWSPPAARGFLTVSGAMLASGGVASLVLLAARARILHQQGFAVGGQFDAAWAISMNHVSLLLGSLQAYCLPIMARSPDRAERSAHLTRMLTSAALAAAAVVCAIALLKPLILTLLYSGAFRDAARYLRWTLIGDYFKVAGWVLSIPMLASADMRSFLTADLGAYLVFAGGTVAAAHYRGAAEGTAIAFVLMCTAHVGITGTIAWRRYGFRPGQWTSLIWLAGLVVIIAVSTATWRQV